MKTLYQRECFRADGRELAVEIFGHSCGCFKFTGSPAIFQFLDEGSTFRCWYTIQWDDHEEGIAYVVDLKRQFELLVDAKRLGEFILFLWGKLRFVY
jgi:hypothetical protein